MVAGWMIWSWSTLATTDPTVVTGAMPWSLIYSDMRQRLIWHGIGFLIVCGIMIALGRRLWRAELARKRTEEELSKTISLLDELLAQAPIGFAYIDRQLRFVRINEQLARFNGLPVHAHVGRPLTEVVPTFMETVKEVTDRILATGQAVKDHEFCGTTAAEPGVTHFWRESWYPVWNRGDISGFGVIVEDITDRKRAETALRDSEARFRLTFDQSPVGKIMVDCEFRPLRINDALCRYLGYSRDELMGMTFPDYTHPDDLADDLSRAKALCDGHGEGFMIEKRYLRKDGQVVWAHLAVDAVRDPEGKPLYLVGLVQDITERKTAEEGLRKTVYELAHSNKELEQFASVTSHDLQEPLRMVMVFAGLLRDRYEGRLDATADEYIGFIVESSSRMQILINDLLAYSYVGAKPRESVPVNVQESLDAALANLKEAISVAGARITQDAMPSISADSVQLTQVFQNLIGNSIKYANPEVVPQIHIGGMKGRGEWLFFVRDNGIGIDPQYSERIFEIFQRLHVRDQYSGSGIGLAICKKVVERHHGRIWVESQPGKGATFHFSLPM